MREDLSESIIESIVTLPTIPSILADLNGAIADPDSSASDIAGIISRDPATTTKVLRLANSAYYGLRSKVSTIKHAVTMLGFNIIRNLVLTATVFDISSQNSISGLFERDMFWRHSLGVGVAAKVVAKEAFPNAAYRGDEFFVCGLLHDLGKIILGQYLQQKFEDALVLSRDESIPLYEAEKTTIGCDHSEVGGLLASRWSLSGEIIAAVGHHHAPLEVSAEQFEYAAVTHLADVITRVKEIGSGGGANPTLDREVWDALKIDKRKIPAMIQDVDNALAVEEFAI